MRKIQNLLVISVLLLGLSACGSDSKEDTPPEEKVTADVTYNVAGEQDLLTVSTITVKYTGKDGNEVEETVTALPWKKEIKEIEVPFTATLKIFYALKSGLSLDKDTYKLGYGSGIAYTTTDGQFKYFSGSSSMTIAKDKVEEYIALLEERSHESSEEITASEAE